ncbi:MAG: AAA family ATPase [Bacteroides sp. SM23_62_1]|nr:MAG: AAA family ATPase [Bacteroides sp. SM23_62_1]
MSLKTGKILVIDDDQDILLTTKVVLKKQFDTIVTETDPERVFQGIRDGIYDVILLDMNFRVGATSGKEGLEWLRKIVKTNPDALVIMITAYGDIDLAVQAMKEGAIDFIVKPWDNKKLLATVTSAHKLSESRKEIANLREKQVILKEEIDQHYSEIIGQSEEMEKVFETIRKVSVTDANILILGENGTGKELVARAIHKNSTRAAQIFIPVDLGALPETLFESELFGHVKGAFTDARENRSGRFKIASGGTLFLDEIGNLSLPLQAKLLSAIEKRHITPVGSNEQIPVDIRLICATNTPLYELVSEKKFREDLLYRINTVEIRVPPLRERVSDLPLLTDYFKDIYARRYSKGKVKISRDSYHKLCRYNWPGNIRELQHVVERAIILSESDILKPDDFLVERFEIRHQIKEILNMEEVEKQTILNALERNNHNMTKAAEELGMARTTLYRKMKRYDI